MARLRVGHSVQQTLQLTPLAWETYQGILIPSRSSVTWADEGSPWLIIELDDVAYNVEVQEYILAVGR
jgi:hypothetical protein